MLGPVYDRLSQDKYYWKPDRSIAFIRRYHSRANIYLQNSDVKNVDSDRLPQLVFEIRLLCSLKLKQKISKFKSHMLCNFVIFPGDFHYMCMLIYYNMYNYIQYYKSVLVIYYFYYLLSNHQCLPSSHHGWQVPLILTLY